MIDTAEASSKRVAANRRNAQKSTGPRTPEGKARVRLNALKHGLTAQTVVLPGEDAEALQTRVEAWKDDLRPRNTLESYLVERAAQVSWQLDRADRTVAARLTDQMRFGDADEAVAEVEEVADLGRRLFWDPRGPIALYPHFEGFRPTPRISWPETVEDPLNPARMVNRLEMTATGCRWLLDRWGELRRLLDDGLRWQAHDRLKAIRMLGAQPMDALADDRVLMLYLACNAMNPGGPSCFDDLATELSRGEAERFAERVRLRDAQARQPEGPSAGEAVLRAIIAGAVARLEALLALHRERRAVAGAGRLDARAFDDSDDGERLRRYQLAVDRSFHRTIQTFLKVRKQADESSTTDEPAFGEADETKPTAADLPPVPPLATPGPAGIPPRGGAPTTGPLESRLEAESVPDEADETNPIVDESEPFVADVDGATEAPSAGGRDRSRPLPPIVVRALEELARRQATDFEPPRMGGTSPLDEEVEPAEFTEVVPGEGPWSARTRALLAAMAATPGP